MKMIKQLEDRIYKDIKEKEKQGDTPTGRGLQV